MGKCFVLPVMSASAAPVTATSRKGRSDSSGEVERRASRFDALTVGLELSQDQVDVGFVQPEAWAT